MINWKSIKRYKRQIFAIIEKETFLEFRYKSKLISRFFNPIIQLFILIFVFGLIFNIKSGYKIGYWDGNNFLLFLFIAFILQFSHTIIFKYETIFYHEKYWKTLSATMIAPVNKFTLLIGILLSELLIIIIPVSILLIIAYILYPISIIFLFLVFIVFLFIYLIFASMGLFIGMYAISNEEYIPYFKVLIRIIMLLSCRNYPKEIFPEIIQYIVLLNPFYYLFDIFRLVWYLGVLEYSGMNPAYAISYISFIHIIVFLSLVILSPLIAIIQFNRLYKKHGITGF